MSPVGPSSFTTSITEGDRLMTAASKVLQEFYGLRSEKLAEFHLQPFRGRSRASKAKEPAPQPPPEPATAAVDPQ